MEATNQGEGAKLGPGDPDSGLPECRHSRFHPTDQRWLCCSCGDPYLKFDRWVRGATLGAIRSLGTTYIA
jgi:hypothetical protein